MASLYIIFFKVFVSPQEKKKSMKCDVVFACPHGRSVNQATLQQLCSHFNIKLWYHLSSFVKYVLNKQDWKIKLLSELKNRTILRKFRFPFQTLLSNIVYLLGWHVQIYKILLEICWLHSLSKASKQDLQERKSPAEIIFLIIHKLHFFFPLTAFTLWNKSHGSVIRCVSTSTSITMCLTFTL